MTPETLKAAGYEGWSVVLRDGARLFEARPWRPGLAPLIAGVTLSFRVADRTTMDWRHVPQEQIQRLEVYFAGKDIVLERGEGKEDLRFIQYKRGSLLVESGSGNDPDLDQGSPRRTGITAYYAGFFDEALKYARLWELNRQHPVGREIMPMAEHPCWPAPFGWALAPHVLGLTPNEVPACPVPVEV